MKIRTGLLWLGLLLLTEEAHAQITPPPGGGGGGGTPGGANTQVQYDKAGVFGGITGATSDGTNLSVTTQAAGDATTKAASDAFVATAIANAIAGVNPAVAVLAASTANVVGTYTPVAGIGDFFTVTATGAFTLDGIAINTIGQRVLLKNQTSGFQNGVYTATVVGAVAVSPVFTRALDYDTPSDINSTGAIPVQSGTANTTTSWLLTSTVNTVGTDALTYAQFSVSPGAGAGVSTMTVYVQGGSVVTSGRTTETLYQNTGIKPLFVTVSVLAGGSGAALQITCGPTNTPSQIQQAISLGNSSPRVCVTFIVLPNYYFEASITVFGSGNNLGTLLDWIEWS